MKTLFLLLARNGDNYMNWPLLRAYRRQFPERQIHVLVRPKFKAAFAGLEVIDHVIDLPSQKWYDQADSAIGDVKNFVTELKQQNYSEVINLSYSLFSSYLTHAISKKAERVYGYTRFQDGSFSSGDPVSQYFFSQVGEKKSNRLHLVDLFSSTLQLDLSPADFEAPNKSWMKQEFDKLNLELPSRYFVIHLGASQAKKCLFSFQWARFIKYFLQKNTSAKLILIGSQDESSIAEEVEAVTSSEQIVNWVGKTTLPSLFWILSQAQKVIGCDSVMMQMSNLTNTPCFNLSFSTVNFWETGPLAAKSHVYLSERPELFSAYQAVEALQASLEGKAHPKLIDSAMGLTRFDDHQPLSEEWQLLQALYLNEKFPMTQQLSFAQAATQMSELNQVILQNLRELKKKPGQKLILNILEQSEKLLESLAKSNSMTEILLNWLNGRKVAVAPQSTQKITHEYILIHSELESILKIYSLEELKKDLPKKGSSHG